MIWHVIKKDLRGQWWLGPVLIVSAIGYFVGIHYRFALFSTRFGGVDPWVAALPYGAMALALARAVQLDSPATRRGDWHTRPMSRWTVLAAKACLALCGVILPWGLVDFGVGMDWGLSPAQAFAGAAIHMSAVAGGLLLLVAIAAATSNLLQFMLAVVLLLAGVMLILMPAGVLIGVAGVSLPLYASPGLIDLQLGVASAGAIAALLLLYDRRMLAKAWGAILLATIGVELAGIATGLVLGANWPAIAVAEPIETRNLRIEAAGNPVIRVLSPKVAFLSTPLRILKPEDLTLEVDRARIDRVWRGGKVQHSYISRGGVLGWDMATGAEPVSAFQPVKIDARYRLRVRRTLAPIRLDGDALLSLPGGGTCRVTHRLSVQLRTSAFDPVTVQCISGAPLCLDIAREGDNRGRFASGCGNSSRILTGFYTQGFPASIDGRPVTITRNQVLGMIDRSLGTGWSTPTVEPFEKTRPPAPRKPA